MNLSGANKLMGDLKGNFDGHVHVFRANLPMTKKRRYTPDYNAEVTEFRQLLLDNELDGALLVQPSFLGTDNSFLLEVLNASEAHRGLTFKGVCVLEPNTSWDQLQALNQTGIIGLRLNLLGQCNGFDISEWRTLLQAADRLGWHVELHCEGENLPSILPKLLSTCKHIVIDHFGLPKHGNISSCPGWRSIMNADPTQLFIKASAPYRLFPNDMIDVAVQKCLPIYQNILEHLGRERMIWGSDWPWTGFENGHTYGDTARWERFWCEGQWCPLDNITTKKQFKAI